MIWYVLAAVLGVLLFQQFWTSYSQVETIPYSEFEALLGQGKVAEVTVSTDFDPGHAERGPAERQARVLRRPCRSTAG